MISFGSTKCCSPLTMVHGCTTPLPCSKRSLITAPRQHSSRSENTPCSTPKSSSRWQRRGIRLAHIPAHANLSKKSPADAKDEIEKGISAVRLALGVAAAPFFRFPALMHPSEMVAYLGARNIASFSTDLDSFDFRIRKPEQLIQSVMNKLQKHGKGIVLMHDFQRGTANALPELLLQLKARGYNIVHARAKDSIQTLPEYDALVAKEQNLPTVSKRQTTAVVRTISE